MRAAVIACVACSGADLEPVLSTCRRLTPRIERHPGALVLDLSGCERLVLGGARRPEPGAGRGPWPALAEALHRRLAARCPSGADPTAVRVGLAATRTAAWLAATASRAGSCRLTWCVVGPNELAAFLQPLPSSVLLGVPGLAGVPGAAEALARLAQGGIVTIGQVARLPGAALRRRFGPLGTRLATLAAGENVAPLRVWTSPAWLGARLRLDPPVEVAQLAPMLTPLARHLAARLSQQRQEASALALVLQTDANATVRATCRLGHPVASPDALVDQARRLLARLAEQKTRARIDTMHLRMGEVRLASPRQELLWASQEARDCRAARRRLLAVDGPLADRGGGACRLLRATLVAPHAVWPEDRYRLVPVVPTARAPAAA